MTDEEIATLLEGLPGGARARSGLRDVARGERSLETMWLEMASDRLRRSGIVVGASDPEVHLRLHAECVALDPAGGHATYRALNEELSSFLDALEARLRRTPGL